METRSSKAVADFFSTLLEEPVAVDPLSVDTVELKPLAQLLARVSETAPRVEISSELSPSVSHEPVLRSAAVVAEISSVSDVSATTEREISVSPLTHNTLKDQMTSQFPVLYFRVGDLTMAVPLVKLRGIYPLKRVTKLVGKPAWFRGIQVERGQNINVIDTARYIMAEKYQSQLEKSVNYQYIIVLGDSNWGLLCEELIDSSALSHDDVKWRSGVLKSPWLAGTVKQRMCGLLAVDALTQLLDDSASG